MDEYDDTNYDSLTGDTSESDVASSVESQSASSDQNMSNLSLEEINGILGKNFPTKESALKSIKDTFSYVGKKKEDIAKEVKQTIDPSAFISKEQYEQDMFFSKNPEYDSPEIKKVLSAIAKTDGVTIAEASKSEAFSSIFSAVAKAKKDEQVKSVLSTNPRLQASKNSMQEAIEARNAGNESLAKELAVKAVLESMGK